MLSRQDGNFQDKKTMINFGRFILPLVIIIALALLFFSIKLFFYTPLTPDSSDVMETESKQIENIIKDKQAEKKQENLPKDNINAKENEEPKNADTKPSAKKSDKNEEHVSIVLAKPVKVTSASVSNDNVTQTKNTSPKTLSKPEKQTSEARTLKSGTDTDSKKNFKATSKKTDEKTSGNRQQQNTNKQLVSDSRKKTAETIADKQKNTAGQVKKTNAETDEKKDKAKEIKNETIEKSEKLKKQKNAQNSKRMDVQIGVYADKKNAEQTMQKAKSAGFSAYITEGKTQDKICYRVRVSGSKDKSETQKLAEELKKKGYEVYLIGAN